MMSNDTPGLLFWVLKQCHHPALSNRLSALETLRKEYLEQVKSEFLLRLLEKASVFEEQSTILSLISQMETRAPRAELVDLLASLGAEDGKYRRELLLTLAVLKEDALLDDFLAIIRDRTQDLDFRLEMISLLGKFGEQTPRHALLALLGESDPDIWITVMDALRAHMHHVPLDPILALVDNPEWDVRMAAIRALGAARERSPIEPLVSALADADARVREVAATSMDSLLEWHGARVPIAPLLAALSDEDEDVRESALYSLAKHPAYAPIDLIEEALLDQNPYLRCAAARVLEQMGQRVPERILHQLRKMAGTDPHPNARKYAIRALFLLKGIPPGKAHDFPGEEVV